MIQLGITGWKYLVSSPLNMRSRHRTAVLELLESCGRVIHDNWHMAAWYGRLPGYHVVRLLTKQQLFRMRKAVKMNGARYEQKENINIFQTFNKITQF